MAKWGSSNIMLLHSAPHCCSQLFSQYGMRRQQTLMKDSFVTTSSPVRHTISITCRWYVHTSDLRSSSRSSTTRCCMVVPYMHCVSMMGSCGGGHAFGQLGIGDSS